MINLAPWSYRNLLTNNSIIEKPEFFRIKLLNDQEQYEAVISLKKNLRPSWLSTSEMYRNVDGAGTDKFKNAAVYKAISECLERFAFYQLIETHNKEYFFDENPTTTGMAAYPFFTKIARINARIEGIERWAIHEFNKSKIPVLKHANKIENLLHYELATPFDNLKISLLVYEHPHFFAYGFAGGLKLDQSFTKALIELDRNIRVLEFSQRKNQNPENFTIAVDKTISYFSTQEGYNTFNDLIKSSPSKIINTNPKVLCDRELKGEWTQYAKVWRFLLEESYFDCEKDYKFFMF